MDTFAGLTREELEEITGRVVMSEAAALQPTGAQRRAALLEQVKACVCRDRQNTYGDAEDNFADIAALVNIVLAAKLKAPLAPADVATISACIKLARIKTSPGHIDNWVDLAGYAICGGGIMQKEGENDGSCLRAREQENVTWTK